MRDAMAFCMGRASRGNADVRVREHKLSHGGVQREPVHAAAHRQNQHGGRGIQSVRSRHEPRTRLQGVLSAGACTHASAQGSCSGLCLVEESWLHTLTRAVQWSLLWEARYSPKTVPVGMLASILRLPSRGSKTATYSPSALSCGSEGSTASSSSSDASTATLPVPIRAAIMTSF